MHKITCLLYGEGMRSDTPISLKYAKAYCSFILKFVFQMFMMQAPQQPQQSRPLTAYPPPSVMAQVQQVPQQPQLPQQPQPPPMPAASYPAAPEKPAKPFDLFFKHQVNVYLLILSVLSDWANHSIVIFVCICNWRL